MDRIGLLVQLLGSKQAITDLQKMLSLKKQMENGKTKMNLDVTDIRKKINELKKEYAQLLKEFDRKQRLGLDTSDVLKRIKEIKTEIRDLANKREEVAIDVRVQNEGLRVLNSQISEVKANAMTLRDVLSGAGTWFSAIGSGLQRMGGFLNTDVWSYISQTLTQLGTQSILSNLEAAANRFDTFNTYAPYMEAVGISAERANKSLNEVDQSIRGLPIGLDEAAIDIRRTTMLMDGDVETATKYVEGFNQALIAGGAPAQMQNYARLEMQRLLASGELSQKRQWMSLINGLGVSTQYLKDAMGYTDMTTKEFEDMIYDPDRGVEGEEVIRGFAKLADDEGLQELIRIYKTTVQSGLSNVHYALVRGLQRVFDAGNETMEATIGMNFSEYLESGRDFIDEAFLGVADWIRKNPDTIESIFREVENLASRAEKFDWGRLANSIIKSIESIVDIATWVYDHVPEGVIQKFLTFSMVWASPLGRAFSGLGSLLTTMAYLPFPQLGRLTRGMGALGRFTGSLKSIRTGFLGISAYIGVIAEIGAVIWEFTKVAETISKADLSGLDQNLKPAINFFANGGALATILTGIFTGISAIPGGALAVGTGELLSAGLIALIGQIGAVIDKFVDVAGKISSTTLPSTQKLQNVFDIMEIMSEGFSSAKVRLGSKWRTKQLNAMIDTLEGLADAMPALQNISDFDLDTESIKKTVNSVLDVYKTIDETIESFLGEYETRTNARMNSWQDAKIVGNITAVIEDLGATVDAIAGIEDKLNEYGLFNSPNGGENMTLQRITSTLDTIINIMEGIDVAISEKDGLIGTLAKKIRTGMEDDIVKNYNDAMQSIADLITTIQSNRDTFNSIMTGHGHNRTLDPGFAAMKENVKALLDSISNGKDGVLDGIYESVTSIGKRMEEQDFDGLAAIIEDMQSAMESIGNIFTTVQSYADELVWVGQIHKGDNATTFTQAIANLNTFVDSVKTIDWEGLGSIDVGNLETNTNAMVIGFNKVMTIANTLIDMQETLATVNMEGGALYNLKKLLADLTTAFSGDGATLSATNFIAMANSLQVLQTALEGIANVNLGTVTGDIKSMAKQLKDVAQKSKDGAKYLNDLRDKIIAAGGAANSNSGKFSGLIDSLKKTSTNASNAYNNLYNLASILNSFTDKTININVNTNGLDEAIARMRVLNALASTASATRNALNAVSGVFRAQGGKINYLSKGGMPMKPRGTDTVPAMLTPGEWVINRRASRAFGDNFMRKINNMDIPGAMDALMQRSKWMPSGGVYYTTNNYNNQSVTQHFSDKKDSRTSYRRANRYLGAL